MNRTIIDRTTLVTMNPGRDILEGHSLVIDDDRISAILPQDHPSLDRRGAGVIDGQRKFVFPGLINTHNHLFQTLTKGLGDDKVLADWLADMTFPCAAHLTPDDVYHAAMLGCVEGIRCGTTTQLDYMYPHNRDGLSDGVVQAFKVLGIRGILGRGMMNTGEQFGVPRSIMQDVDTVERDCRRLFDTYHDTENGRIKVWTAPAAIWSNTEELLKTAWRITREYGSRFTIHISETPFDREAGKEIHGVWDFEVLEKLGIVGPEVLMVHCVYLTPSEILRSAELGLKVSHNTISNMYLSSGIAPVPEMLEAGVCVALGVDGAASNNSQDMIELMKSTALLHKVNRRDPLAMTGEAVLAMATIEGAKAIGEEENLGSLELGKKADCFIYNPELSAKSTPVHHPVSTLVYSGTHCCVETVLVDGRPLLLDGVLTAASEVDVIRHGQRTAEDLAARAGIRRSNNDRETTP